LAVKRPARAYKTAMERRFTTENAKGTQTASRGPDRATPGRWLPPPRSCARPAARPARGPLLRMPKVRSRCRFVPPFMDPPHTRFTQRLASSLSETTVRPDPTSNAPFRGQPLISAAIPPRSHDPGSTMTAATRPDSASARHCSSAAGSW
jgi:hypothetical protein